MTDEDQNEAIRRYLWLGDQVYARAERDAEDALQEYSVELQEMCPAVTTCVSCRIYTWEYYLGVLVEGTRFIDIITATDDDEAGQEQIDRAIAFPVESMEAPGSRVHLCYKCYQYLARAGVDDYIDLHHLRLVDQRQRRASGTGMFMRWYLLQRPHIRENWRRILTTASFEYINNFTMI